MLTLAVLFVICVQIDVEGYLFDRFKRADSASAISNRITIMGDLNFSSPVYPEAVERRNIACFFVFDKNASAELRNDLDLGTQYANQLAKLASLYMAHANIVVTNAGVEMWTDRDRITFPSDDNINYYAMPNLVTQFQEYLDQTQKSAFGTTYAVGVLIAKKNSVQGGYSQGPPCSTSGVSLINYRPMPWTIGGLIAHELAHTLSVVHPSDLAYICAVFKDVPFCQTGAPLPEECLCNVNPSQCLMTFYFGQAKVNAPRYTPCDIQMMNHFSSNIPCLLK